MRRLALTLCCLSLLAVPATASAADFNPAAGTYTVNTTTMKITGPGGTNISGVDQGGVAVFNFGTVNIKSGVTLNASGSRPLRLAALGSFTLGGIINGNGTSPNNSNTGAGAPGGPGGGAGGSGSTTAWTKGSGLGGGGRASGEDDGGGGGGFGGAGARGGTSATFESAGVGGAAGPAYSNLDGGFVGGSGGSGSAFSEGGGGGGGIALFGRTVAISSTGQVHADGGDGAFGRGASGGGSGGAVLLVGGVIDNKGQLTARGGQGGTGGCCGDGGGGGGGRVGFRGTVIKATGTPNVTGGTSGTKGGLSHGALSPDFKGADGVVSQSIGTQVINFDDLATATGCFATSSELTNRYASRGVHFAGPTPGTGGTILHQGANGCGGFGVTGYSETNFLAFSTLVPYSNGKLPSGPETITFDKPVSTATINTGQSSGGTATLTAFRGSTVVGSAFTSSTAAVKPLTVNGEHITKLTLQYTGVAITFDDLRWNTEPTAGNDAFSVGAGGTLNGNLLGNDSDADNDPLTAAVSNGPAHGSVSVRPDGGFTYTPAGGFSGSDSFSYHVNDGDGNSKDASVGITVTPPPTPPPPPPPILGSTITNFWIPFKKFTKVSTLAINDLPAGARVKVDCKTKKKKQQKKACPFKSKTFKNAKAKRKLNLTKRFSKKKLPIGTKVTITMTAPNFTGKRFVYKMRKNKAPKRPKRICILANGKPGKCP
jgi:hypothetical protein